MSDPTRKLLRALWRCLAPFLMLVFGFPLLLGGAVGLVDSHDFMNVMDFLSGEWIYTDGRPRQ